MTPRISVIFPIHNQPGVLCEAIASIRNQTYLFLTADFREKLQDFVGFECVAFADVQSGQNRQ